MRRTLGVVVMAPLAALVTVGSTGCSGFGSLEGSPSRLDSLQSAYRRDAVSHAVGIYSSRSDPLSEQRVAVPDALVDSVHAVLDALLAFDHPARDSVVDMFRIHARHFVAPYQFMIGVESTAPWVEAWSTGETFAGVPVIDSVLEELSAVVIDSAPFNSYRIFNFRAAVPVNFRALEARLGEQQHVWLVGEALTPVGDGSRMTVVPASDGWQITAHLRWGDCIAGCTGEHTWSFQTDGERRVTFLGFGGDPIPEGVLAPERALLGRAPWYTARPASSAR